MTTSLQDIADVLGLPVSAFTEPEGASFDGADLFELLRLWSAIDSEADRQRLLTLARSLARIGPVLPWAAE